MTWKCKKTGRECEHATPPGHYINGQYCMYSYYSPKLVGKVDKCPMGHADADGGS